MKSILLTASALFGLLLCVAGLAGALLSGLDIVYGGLSLLVALTGGAVLAVSGRALRTAACAEAEGTPGRRSRPKPGPDANALKKGQRL